MGGFPSYIMEDGKTGIFDDAFGLEDSGKAAEGCCTDDRKPGMRRGQPGTKAVDTGGDLGHAGQKGTGNGREQRKLLDPCGKDGEEHNITADNDHRLAGGGNGVFDRQFFYGTGDGEPVFLIFAGTCQYPAARCLLSINMPGDNGKRKDGKIKA